MAQTSRQIVTNALKFNFPQRIPRDMWLLPWAQIHYPEQVANIQKCYPNDFDVAQYFYEPSKRVKGDPYQIGEFIDEWGCCFRNIQQGIIGEVDQPIIEDISDWKQISPPYEQLPAELSKPYDTIQRYYENSDKFVLANICPRPWERYQFIRGTQNAFLDLMMPDLGFRDLLNVIHEFNMRELEIWAPSAVDGIRFMDDWGSDQS